ncbi:DUF4179 domain-containing protein [Paenibacillus sp. GCM10027626]|uniref:DUF4179 domain-containing protein n=1 Tax=Paenibacillus sp. GCM10027626 TaxID=3273411 RepID=UPI00363825C8
MNLVNLDKELAGIPRDRTTELPDTVRTRIDSTLDNLPERQKRKARSFLWGTTAAALVAGCTLGSAFVSPDMAAALRQVPGIQSIFRIAGDYGLKMADEKGLVTEVNQSVTVKGITITVNEVMYDGARLSIGYLQKSASGIEELGHPEFQINGKSFNSPGSGSGSRVDDHTYAGVINLTPETEFSDEFDLTMTVFNVGKTHGKWEFSFPVRKIASSNKAVMPMMTRTYGDLTVTVQKVIFTPSSTELTVQTKRPKQAQGFINYDIIDDKGVVLERRGGSGGGRTEGDYEIMDFKQQFGPAEQLPKSIKVRPVLEAPSSGPLKETRLPLTGTPTEEHPLVLPQGESGALSVTKVEYFKDKTLVHYQTEGSQPFLQSTQLWIEDETGKKHLLLDKATETVDPVNYKFIREFPAFRPEQKLTFVTRELPPPNYTKDLEMTISIAP